MVTLEKVRQAAALIQNRVIRTPLIQSPALSRMFGGEIYLKLENLQNTGSFKIRGATYKLLYNREKIGPGGVVESWTWITSPKPKNHLQKPFAWALIRLDGADTALLHAVDAGSEDAMSTGMRVTAQWADETVGQIQDIACFVPEESR